jgi:type IV pilus assembly protein PilV
MKSLAHMNSPNRASIPFRSRARGFTLLEVMVALMITSIGLLGIAKIQVLAYASTGSASLRSLVALQAAGLAATMHANRNYWAGISAPVTLIINGPNILDATLGPLANTPQYCWSGANTPCDATTLAAFDLHTYANALNGMLGNSAPVTTIQCPAGNNPVSCTINITWNEHAVSINSQSAATTTQTTFAPTYTLFVEP